MGAKTEAANAGQVEKGFAATAKALDRRRFRAAIERMRGCGGDVAVIGEILGARLDASPEERRGRRDAAIVALAETFHDTRWHVAGEVAKEILRYATSAWTRHDCRLDRASLIYAGNARRLALFTIMREGGDGAVIGRRQIAGILAKAGSARANESSDREPPEGADLSPDGNSAPLPISTI